MIAVTLISSLLGLPPGDRAHAVEQWLADQPEAGPAARTLAQALAAMETAPYKVEGSNADTALIYFLEAEGMRFPLDAAAETAEAAGDPEVAAQLWAHASTSALLLGELADLPYAYAKRAILTGTDDRLVWSAFQDSLYGYTTGFFEDIEDWQKRAASGELRHETVAQALAAAAHCARDWAPEDRELLELIQMNQ